MPHRPPRIGIFGAFDVRDLAELAVRRVVERELIARRADLDLLFIAPFGATRPSAFDEGRPAAPLESVLAEDHGGRTALDAIILVGDVLGDSASWAARYSVPTSEMERQGIGPLTLRGTRGGAPAAPFVTWFAAGVVDSLPSDILSDAAAALRAARGSLRNEASRRLLAVEDGAPPVIGDPLLLAGRVLEAETLRKRADLLRLCGVLPDGPRLVIELGDSLNTEERAAVREAVVNTLERDHRFSAVAIRLDARSSQLAHAEVGALSFAGPHAERIHILPDWTGLDDVAAAITHSSLTLATTAAGAHLAAGCGRPVVALQDPTNGRLDSAIVVAMPSTLATLLAAAIAEPRPPALMTVARLDASFDELAQRLPQSSAGNVEPQGPVSAVDMAALSETVRLLQQRLVDERTSLQAEISRLDSRLSQVLGSPEHKFFEPIRQAYRRWWHKRT